MLTAPEPGLDAAAAAAKAAGKHRLDPQLGWKVTKIGMIGTRHGTVIGVRDVREVPKEHRAVISDAMHDRMRARLHKVWGELGPAPAQRGSVALMTQEFRAATGSA
ncbi:hypothetical protein [Streptomyces exfoliatus]|uniref:hypothetical protein n=1 Tax=Streptomyces exfoliatus TaxID=1905 RepID=UPI0006904D9F|nr:hypothetical protein [Streptomyces exfoliatus]